MVSHVSADSNVISLLRPRRVIIYASLDLYFLKPWSLIWMGRDAGTMMIDCTLASLRLSTVALILSHYSCSSNNGITLNVTCCRLKDLLFSLLSYAKFPACVPQYCDL